METQDLKNKANSIKKMGIIGTILYCTVFLLPIGFILSIICGVKILSTEWKNEEIENQKLIWGILSFVVLGPISGIIFGSIASNKY